MRPEVPLELHLSRVVKSNRKGIYRYTSTDRPGERWAGRGTGMGTWAQRPWKRYWMSSLLVRLCGKGQSEEDLPWGRRGEGALTYTGHPRPLGAGRVHL